MEGLGEQRFGNERERREAVEAARKDAIEATRKQAVEAAAKRREEIAKNHAAKQAEQAGQSSQEAEAEAVRTERWRMEQQDSAMRLVEESARRADALEPRPAVTAFASQPGGSALPPTRTGTYSARSAYSARSGAGSARSGAGSARSGAGSARSGTYSARAGEMVVEVEHAKLVTPSFLPHGAPMPTPIPPPSMEAWKPAGPRGTSSHDPMLSAYQPASPPKPFAYLQGAWEAIANHMGIMSSACSQHVAKPPTSYILPARRVGGHPQSHC